jgi:hypothetical protein
MRCRTRGQPNAYPAGRASRPHCVSRVHSAYLLAVAVHAKARYAKTFARGCQNLTCLRGSLPRSGVSAYGAKACYSRGNAASRRPPDRRPDLQHDSGVGSRNLAWNRLSNARVSGPTWCDPPCSPSRPGDPVRFQYRPSPPFGLRSVQSRDRLRRRAAGPTTNPEPPAHWLPDYRLLDPFHWPLRRVPKSRRHDRTPKNLQVATDRLMATVGPRPAPGHTSTSPTDGASFALEGARAPGEGCRRSSPTQDLPPGA